MHSARFWAAVDVRALLRVVVRIRVKYCRVNHRLRITANALQSGVHTRLARSGPSSRYQRLCTNAWTRAGGSILGRDRCSSGGVRISADVPNPITFHKVYVDVHNDAALSSGNELDAHKPCTSNCDRYPTLTCTPRARLKSRVTSARTCDV